MGLAGRIGRCNGGITTKLSADGRGAAIQYPRDGSLAQPLELANLDSDAFFNAEFLVRHAYTVPDGSGVALSFCRRPLQSHGWSIGNAAIATHVG